MRFAATYLPILLRALLGTLFISVTVIFVGTILGGALALLVLARARFFSFLARGVTELLLAVPPLVLLVWLYFSLPLITPALVLSGWMVAILGLSFSLAAFVAEIVRGGINAIPAGEREAAILVGMNRLEIARHILVPQVFRSSWPPLMGQYITALKMSTLASVIAVPELLHQADNIIAQTYRPLEIYSLVAALFVVLVLPLNVLFRRIQQTQRLGGTLEI